MSGLTFGRKCRGIAILAVGTPLAVVWAILFAASVEQTQHRAPADPQFSTGFNAMSKSGEACQTPGLYLSSGRCGHAAEWRITKGQHFPNCKICGKAVNWTLLRKKESEKGDS